MGVQATEEAPYEPGSVYSCNFGDGDIIFYVVSEEENNIKLIMNENFEDKVKWNESDDESIGPITALAYLESETSSWDVLRKSGGKIELPSADFMTNVISEWKEKNIDAEYGPDWLRTNLWEGSLDLTKDHHYEYWTSTPIPSDYDYYYAYHDGYIISLVGIVDVEHGGFSGVRPLITVPKENIKVS